MRLIAAVSLLTSCVSTGTGAPRDVKVYRVQPTTSYCHAAWCQGKIGLVRAQAEEVKSFEDARGYYCTSGVDLQRLIESCPR